MAKVKTLLLVLIAGIVCGIASCSTFQVFKKDFNGLSAGGYATIAAMHELSAVLLDGHVIGSKDSKNIDQQLVTAAEGIDVARTLSGTAADDRLAVALAAVNSAKTYLCGKQPANPNCLER